MIVQLLDPRSVIDLGVGHGKTGLLLREYLDIMKERYKPDEWQTKIYGIEGFEKYKNPVWEYAYDQVCVCDALQGLSELPDVDLIMALDIWEHFDESYAARALEVCLSKAQYVLLSTPKDPLPQGEVLGNVYERHVSKWSPREFDSVPYLLVTCTDYDWILLLSSHAAFPKPIRRLASPKHHLLQGLQVAISLWAERARMWL